MVKSRSRGFISVVVVLRHGSYTGAPNTGEFTALRTRSLLCSTARFRSTFQLARMGEKWQALNEVQQRTSALLHPDLPYY